MNSLQMYPEPPETSEVPLLNSRLDHMSSLNIEQESMFVRLTGVICTIGPACRDVSTLESMLEAGMNIARLNFSHGTHAYHKQTIDNIRQAVDNYSKRIGAYWPVAIALDTKGSEIRTGKVIGDEVQLIKGNTVKLTNDEKYKESCDSSLIYIDTKDLYKLAKVGNLILIDDSSLSLICKEVKQNEVICEIENTTKLGSYKGVSFSGVEIKRSPVPTERDKADLTFALENDLDFIFVSFASEAQALREIRKFLRIPKGRDILLVAKIENRQAVENLHEIMEEADGLMVERGDLSSEILDEKIFVAQKSIVARCNRFGRPVICATQLLESMTEKPRPTRAESADVANAVLDGVDCVMLSGETAKGLYPVECVRTMAAICREAEAAIWQAALFNDIITSISPPISASNAIAVSAVEGSEKCKAKAIIVLTVSGSSAALVAKYRPKCPIIAITTSMKVARQCHLFRGLLPLYYPVKLREENFLADLADHIDVGIKFGVKQGFLKPGDNVITVTGWREGTGNTNALHVSQV